MNTEAVTAWQDTTREFIEEFYADPSNSKKVSVSDVVTTLTVRDLRPPSRRFLVERFLQSGSELLVEYDQLLAFNPTVGTTADVDALASTPFDSSDDRFAYVTMLQNSGNGVLAKVTAASEVTVPETPKSSGGGGLSVGAIAGIAVGGAVVLMLVMWAISRWVLNRSNKHNGYVGDVEDAPPTSIRTGQDDVSTMDGYSKVRSSRESLAGYGDQRYV